jgi:hypothetical protein
VLSIKVLMYILHTFIYRRINKYTYIINIHIFICDLTYISICMYIQVYIPLHDVGAVVVVVVVVVVVGIDGLVGHVDVVHIPNFRSLVSVGVLDVSTVRADDV